MQRLYRFIFEFSCIYLGFSIWDFLKKRKDEKIYSIIYKVLKFIFVIVEFLVTALLFWAGCVSFRDKDIKNSLMFFSFAILMILSLIYILRKMFFKRNPK